MFKRVALALTVLLNVTRLYGQTINGKKTEPVNLANVFVDTHAGRYDFFISASLPYGMVALSPDTKPVGLWKAGYQYDDKYIYNFSHVHNIQTAGIPVMPVTGQCKGNLGFEANKSRFSHDKEVAYPGYHKVFLEDYGITAELTASCRVGMHRYTFPKASQAHFLFDIGAELGPTKMSYAYARKVSNNEIEGYSVMAPTSRRKKPFMVYFVARFSKPFNDFTGWKKNGNGAGRIMVTPEADIIQGDSSGFNVTYNNVQKDDKVILKVGISYVSIKNARLNMDSEVPGWDFDRVVADAKKAWSNYLGQIAVEGGTHAQQVKLYTDLIHTATKRIASDVDGSYADWTGPQPIIRQLPLDSKGKPTHEFLDGDGMWGSQWNLNILWSLIYPKYGNWMAETLLDFYRNAGILSRSSWAGDFAYVMVGDHTVPLLAALMSTRRNTFDPNLAYAAAYKNAFPGGIRDRAGYETGPNPAGGGIDWYIKLGYVPLEIAKRGAGIHRAGTAMTLEYAYQDWCLGTMANLLGKKSDAKLFEKRSANWRNVFDTQVGWVRPRYASGKWMEGFTPTTMANTSFGFIEGSAATYTFYVPQNVKGLIGALGGNEKFAKKLDSNFIKASARKFFTPNFERGKSWVNYENEPSGSMAHLFSYAAMPWKTQYWVSRVKEETYGGTDPDSGYRGDDDQGLLSSLGVLMSIGLFDVHGCVGESPGLEITTPLFDKVILNFPSLNDPGKITKFEILVKRLHPGDIYIQNTHLNGKAWSSFRFPVSEFFKGGRLEIQVGPQPNKKWGLN